MLLLSKDISKYSEQLAELGISFKEITVRPVSIDLNLLVSAAIQVGGKMMKALQPFGNTRVDDMLTFSSLGAIMPHMQHLIRLGDSLEYDKSFKIHKISRPQLTHISLTFEEAATPMSILYVLLFCGSLYNGNDFVDSDLRSGFTFGLFPITKNDTYIIRHRNTTIRQLVGEMWRKGTCYTVPAEDKARWER